MNKKYIINFFLVCMMGFFGFNSLVNAQVLNSESTNTNTNSSGSEATGGDSKNINIIEGEDINSESDSWNLDQIPGLSLNNIDQMIQTQLGTINCAVEDSGGTEFRLGFPPALVFKDQDVDGGECMNALNSMSKYMQADILTNISVYLNTVDSLSPEYKDALKLNLTNQILDLFIENREEIEEQARKNSINNLQAKLQETINVPVESWEEKSKRILDEGKQERNKQSIELVEEAVDIVNGGY